MSLWLGITLILIIAGGFLAYPFFYGKADIGKGGNTGTDTDSRADINSQADKDLSNPSQLANIQVFRDQQKQYQQQLERREITQQQFDLIVAEAEQLLLSNTAIASTPESRKQVVQGLWLLPVLVIIIPLATLWIYQILGAGADEQIAQRLAEQSRLPNASQEMIWDAELIGMINQRIKERPKNVYYWTILAQEAASRGDIVASADYFSQAASLEPGESYLLGQYAQALFFVDSNRFTPRVEKALNNAFALDSSNQTVLGLKGIQAFEGQDYKLAVTFWQAAAQRLDPTSNDWQALQTGIAKAWQLAGDDSAVVLSVALSLDKNISFTAEQWVFVAVLEAEGSPMPIAARKLPASQLPITIQLSDKDQLTSGRSLSRAGNVQVIARLSNSGTATPEPGDWQALSDIIDLNTDNLKLELMIDQQRNP